MLKTLANRYTGDDEAQLMEALQKAQLVVAANSGDIVALRHLIEDQGVDISAMDHVSCGLIESELTRVFSSNLIRTE